MNTIFRLQFLILIIAAISFATFAFASSQAGQPTGGEGVSIVSGWDVSGVHYQLADNPSNLAAVEFDLNAPADVVKASVNSSESVFFNCINTTGYHWVCDLDASVKFSNVNELRVIATGG